MLDLNTLTYRQLQALVKQYRKNAKDIKANAKADVLVEYLKNIKVLPTEYKHESKTAKTSTKKPAKNANGTTKKPVGSVAQKGKPGCPVYNVQGNRTPETPHKVNQAFNKREETPITSAPKSEVLQQKAVMGKLVNVQEYANMTARRLQFKAQARQMYSA